MPSYRYDVRPSPPDPRDFRASALPPVILPAAAEVANVAPIRDQGAEGSCWGFCGTGARQDAALLHGDATVLSPAFLYWKTREAMGDDRDDTGSNMRTGLDVLLKTGVCPESAMPYRAGDWATAPSDDALAAAAAYRIATYARLMSIVEIKTQLAQGRSVMLGISVFRGFEETQDGYVPMFGANEPALGGHAIRCIGYRDDASVAGGGWLTLANSWGTGHGAAGRYFIPYAYLDFQAGEAGTMLSEAWALVAL